MNAKHSVEVAVVIVVGAVLTACGSSSTSESRTSGPTTPVGGTASTSEDVMAEPTINGNFVVAHKRHVALRCYGSGSPAVVFIAGDDSPGSVFPSTLLQPLAEHTMTCTYDRLGTGSSDPPVEARRSIDDVADDLLQMLAAAKIATPVTLVGSSGGGNIAVQFARRHPDALAGLGLLDVPNPSANLDEEFPGRLGWQNPEHIDWPAAELDQTKITGPIGDFPVLIVTADNGQTKPGTKSVWLKLSPNARAVIMHGGHDLYQEIPEEVARKILTTLPVG